MIPFTHEKDDTFEPFDAIFEMANVAPEDHRFGVALKMHILQPGDRWPGHGPRVKFFKKNPRVDYFSISLHPDAARVSLVDGEPSGLASASEVNILIAKVKKYRVPLWNMYFDPSMTQRELLQEMAAVDAGHEVAVRGGRYRDKA